eukprot:gene14646-biopygen8744
MPPGKVPGKVSRGRPIGALASGELLADRGAARSGEGGEERGTSSSAAGGYGRCHWAALAGRVLASAALLAGLRTLPRPTSGPGETELHEPWKFLSELIDWLKLKHVIWRD